MKAVGFAIVFVLLAAWSARAHPGWGIALNSRGEIYFADIDNLKIWKWSPEGGAQTAVSGVWTHHLSLDAADNLYYETEFYQVRTLVEVGADGELTSVLNIVPWGEVKRR